MAYGRYGSFGRRRASAPRNMIDFLFGGALGLDRASGLGRSAGFGGFGGFGGYQPPRSEAQIAAPAAPAVAPQFSSQSQWEDYFGQYGGADPWSSSAQPVYAPALPAPAPGLPTAPGAPGGLGYGDAPMPRAPSAPNPLALRAGAFGGLNTPVAPGNPMADVLNRRSRGGF